MSEAAPYFVVLVHGYRPRRRDTAHLIGGGDGRVLLVPDRLMPMSRLDRGSPEWWAEAWAVGANSRGKLCKFFGSSPVRQFASYADAYSVGQARQRRFKTLEHSIGLVAIDERGMPVYTVIDGEDQATAFMAAIEARKTAQRLAQEQARTEHRIRHPHLDILIERYGRTRGWSLSLLLERIRREGRAAAQAGTAKSSWYRAVRDIKAAGIAI